MRISGESACARPQKNRDEAAKCAKSGNWHQLLSKHTIAYHSRDESLGWWCYAFESLALPCSSCFFCLSRGCCGFEMREGEGMKWEGAGSVCVKQVKEAFF